MRSLFSLTVTVLLLVLAVSSASATQYYVRTDGNDSNTGTVYSAGGSWRTIQKACTTAVAGDDVIIAEGTYVSGAITCANSGTSNLNRITFRAEIKAGSIDSALVFHSGVIVSSTSGCSANMTISGAYVTIWGLSFVENASNVYCAPAADGIAGTAIRCTGSTSGGCWVKQITVDTVYTTSGINLLNVAVTAAVDGSGNRVRSYAIQTTQSNSVIEGNILSAGIDSRGADNVIVRYNRIKDAGSSRVGIVAQSGGKNVQVYSNALEGLTTMTSGGIILGGSTDQTIAHTFECYNCVAHDNVVIVPATVMSLQFQGAKDSAFFNNVGLNGAIGITAAPSSSSSGNTWKNNILSCGGDNASDGTIGSVTIDYNNFFNCTSAPSQTHAVTGDPLFADAVNPNLVGDAFGDWRGYRLRTGSASIGAGTVVTMTGFAGEDLPVNIDYNGTARVAPIDVGIFDTLPATPVLPVIGTISCGTSSGSTIVATTSAEFAAALVTAAANDEANGTTITLTAGATFTGPFTLPVKTGTGCITIRTDASDGSLPSATTRIDPTYASVLPKIVSPGQNSNAIVSAYGAHHYKFIGVEVMKASAGVTADTLVTLGDAAMTSLEQVPHHMEFDRVYIHGWPTTVQTACMRINSAQTIVKNSYIADCKAQGFDAQAIQGGQGIDQLVIANNFLQASGENIMFGGQDPRISRNVPTNIEITNNLFSKPLTWKVGDPTYAGTPWTIKNLFELKNCRRVRLDGNVFEYSWVGGQSGTAIVISPRNQNATGRDTIVEDLTFTNNIVRHVAHGMDISAEDQATNGWRYSLRGSRYLVKNNLWLDVGATTWISSGGGQWMSLTSNPSSLTAEHNTVFNLNRGLYLNSTLFNGEGLIVRNNIAPMNANNFVNSGSGKGNGTAALQGHYPNSYTLAGNVIYGSIFNNTYMNTNYGGGNFFPTSITPILFTNTSTDDYSLQAASPYHNAGTDGTDIGVDWPALQAALALSSGPPADTTPPVLLFTFPLTTLPAGTTSTNFTVTSNEAATVKYGTSDVAYASLPNTASAAGSTYTGTVSGLTNGSTTTIYVRGQDTAGNPNLTSTVVTITVASVAADTTAPSTVTGLAGTAITGGTSISYSWTAATDNVAVSGYQLYLCTPAPCTATVPSGAPVATTSTVITGLSATTAYGVRVKAIDTSNNFSTSYSSEVDVTTTALPGPGAPAQVIGLTVLARPPWQASSGTFVWTPSAEADLAGYRVYPRLDVNIYGPPVLELTPAVAYANKQPPTQYRFSLPVAGTYCFAIAAFNLAGAEGTKSVEHCLTGAGVTARTPATRNARSPLP